MVEKRTSYCKEALKSIGGRNSERSFTPRRFYTGDDAVNIIKQILTASSPDQSPFTIIP